MDNIFLPEKELKSYLRSDKSGGKLFRHQDGQRIPLLPYTTKFSDSVARDVKEDFKSLDGFIGHCYRQVIGKSLPVDMQKLNFKKTLRQHILSKAAEITTCEDVESEKLKAVIDSMFFDEDNLLKYGYKAQLYMFWNGSPTNLNEIGDFICQVFFKQEICDIILNERDGKKHVFHTLIDQCLPELVTTSKKKIKNSYHILDESVVGSFIEDFRFLQNDKSSFLIESALLFKFYYFFYVSRSVLILNDLFNIKEYQLYFTLENESVSESRRTYDSGWKIIESKSYNLYSHTVCLDILNHIPLVEKHGRMSYVQLGTFFDSCDALEKQELMNDVESISQLYFKYAPTDVDWTTFEDYHNSRKIGTHTWNDFEHLVFKFYTQIDFQFEKFGRKSKRNNYAMWFITFCKENMLKNRGRSGFSLNLSNEMLLFLTKLCVKDQQKMRLKDLWGEFKKRGVYFDDPTQQAIVEIYDKINLIEKKSDSGDAQYIRPIL